MAKFLMNVLTGDSREVTARLANGTGAANQFTKSENGKFVKLTATSRYGLCAAGDPIEGKVTAADSMAPADGFNLGSVQTNGRFLATCDGLQATPGTGAIAVGDYVVCGTVVALATALAANANPKVCKATDQPGTAVVVADNLVASINAANVKIANQIKNALFGWRVVAFTGSGTGAVGDIAVCERVDAA